MKIKLYTYKNCDSCRKALKFLDAHNLPYTNHAIRETPPSQRELKKMLGHLDGELRKLFNTAGGDYRELGLKDRIADMTEKEAFGLLSANGNLVKRPFVLGNGIGIVGFREDDWKELFL